MNTNTNMLTDAEKNEQFHNRTISVMKAIGEGIVFTMIVVAWVALCCAC